MSKRLATYVHYTVKMQRAVCPYKLIDVSLHLHNCSWLIGCPNIPTQDSQKTVQSYQTFSISSLI